jgi:tetratricopeptide (TPR) repeat protein
MDSEHRHELKENDLLEFFRNFKNWWAKHGTQTLLVILVCVLALTGYRYFKGKEARERDAAWADLANVSTVEGRQQVAGMYPNRPGLANLALLQAADDLRTQAFAVDELGNPAPATSPEPNEAQRKTLDDAAKLYQRVIDAPQPTEPSLYKLNARMGLAAVHETLGEWDKAEAEYRNVIKEAGAYRNIALVADRQIQTMDSRKEPIAFKLAPPVELPDETSDGASEGETDEPTTSDEPIIVVPESSGETPTDADDAE